MIALIVGVDVAFAPTVDEMYPAGDTTFVEVRGVQDGLCGASRPGLLRSGARKGLLGRAPWPAPARAPLPEAHSRGGPRLCWATG